MSDEEEENDGYLFLAGLKPGDRFRFGDTWVTVTAVLPKSDPQPDFRIHIKPDEEGPTASA